MKMRLVLAAAALALVSACGAQGPTDPQAAEVPERRDSPVIGGGFRGGDSTVVHGPNVDGGTLLQDTTAIVTDGPYIGGGH